MLRVEASSYSALVAVYVAVVMHGYPIASVRSVNIII